MAADPSEDESYMRGRERSLSALTDENEFNPNRKMDIVEYYYLHLFGENLEDSEDNEIQMQDWNFDAEEQLKLKLLGKLFSLQTLFLEVYSNFAVFGNSHNFVNVSYSYSGTQYDHFHHRY